jgi:O-antigen/teichoic acid export membrane protein
MSLEPVSQIPSKAEDIESQPTPNLTDTQDIFTAAKGGGISFAGRLFEYVVRFAFGILIARVIGVEQYGLYILSITVAAIATNIAMLGLQVGMVRFLPPAIHEKDEPSIRGILQICVGFPVLFSLTLAIGLFLLASPVANLVFHDPRLIPVLRIACLLIPMDTLASMAYVITISFKQPKYSVIANNIIAPLTKLLLAAGFLAIGFSTKGVLISQVIASAAAMVVLAYYVNALFSLKHFIGAAKRNTRKILRYSFPAYLGWIINTVSSTLSTMVLGLLGLTAGVGVFAAASRISLIGSMFYTSIGNISTPIIADLHSRGEASLMKTYYQTTTRWLVMFNLPVFLTSVLFAKPLLSIFGDDFTAGATSMMILAIGTLTYTCTGVGANILDMTDHPKVNMVNSMVMVLIIIGLNFLLIPRWGVNGAAAATALSTTLVNIFCLLEVWYFDHMLPYNKSFLKPLLSGLIAAPLTFLLIQHLTASLLLQLAIGGTFLWGTYALALYLLRINTEDIAVIEHLLSRLRLKLNFPWKQAHKPL